MGIIFHISPQNHTLWVFMCFQVSRPYLGFATTLNILLWIVSKMSNLLENGEKCIEKCNFYIKYFDKIKCYADRLYLVFFRPETHIYGPRQANLVLITYASSEGSGEPAHPRSLAEPPLLAHTSSESRGTFRQKARSLTPLNGWACPVKICHDGMLEDTNSLDGAHIFFGIIDRGDCKISGAPRTYVFMENCRKLSFNHVNYCQIPTLSVFLIWATTWQNQQSDPCTQQSAQSDQSFHHPHEETLGP